MKENSKNNIDDLLLKYLTGQATNDEISEVDSWIARNKKNNEYYHKFLSVWESLPNLKDFESIDTESSLKNVKKRIDFGKPKGKIRPMWILVRIAAVLVFFLGIYLVFKSKSGSIEDIKIVKIEATKDLKTVILPDSTTVTLNIASSIEYPEKFEGTERRVKFNGEAYFEVSHDKTKAFIIETTLSEVRVVGTAFNLKAYTNAKRESIVVTEGVVLFSGKGSETKNPISLKKGEKGILDTEQNLLKKEDNADLNFTSWKTGIFEFYNTPLNDALSLLSEYYKCKFEIADNELKSYKISAKYQKLKIEELIDVLEMTLNVKIEKLESTYLLKSAK